MGNRAFDFGKLDRSFHITKLKDGRVLCVNMPKKSVFEQMQRMKDQSNIDDNSSAYKEMCILMAAILSNNKNGERVSEETIENDYDIEEIVAYIKDYGEFVGVLHKDPN